MGWFGDDSQEAQYHDQVLHLRRSKGLGARLLICDPSAFQVTNHKAELSHELIAGAASFEAARAYEKHVAENGQPANHAVAKELL